MRQNNSWLFYKKYFRDIDLTPLLNAKDGEEGKPILETLKDINKDLLCAKLDTLIPNEMAKQFLSAEVLYPGIVTGIGLPHTAGVKEEFRLGIHLEYTSGQPVIYGSSVKGMVRSAFREKEYILSILQENKLPEIDIDRLKEHMFEGLNEQKEDVPICQRDVFFDAVITNGITKKRKRRK
ncbi:MAG: RAMP superfamily CRISPR-associated protein [Tannerellaceae bacterium]|nr:RAMP superfamily CRISPR-associated protein [Tannerellaceae bacterium]